MEPLSRYLTPFFQWKLEHLEQVEISRLDVKRAAKYLQCLVMFYKDEAQRQRAIKKYGSATSPGSLTVEDTKKKILDVLKYVSLEV